MQVGKHTALTQGVNTMNHIVQFLHYRPQICSQYGQIAHRRYTRSTLSVYIFITKSSAHSGCPNLIGRNALPDERTGKQMQANASECIRLIWLSHAARLVASILSLFGEGSRTTFPRGSPNLSRPPRFQLQSSSESEFQSLDAFWVYLKWKCTSERCFQPKRNSWAAEVLKENGNILGQTPGPVD